MAGILAGRVSVSDQYDHAVSKIRERLNGMSDSQIAANNDDELTDCLIQGWVLEPIEEDPERGISATEEREFRQVRDSRRFLGPGQVEVQYAVIEVPLVPRQSNGIALQLRGQTFLDSDVGDFAQFRERDHVIVLRVPLGDSERHLRDMRRMFGYINQDIERHTLAFRPRVLDWVKRRREQVTAHASKFEESMTKLGVQVKRKADAVGPVNVQVKREIKVLRDKPARSPEPYLEPDSLRQIIGLMDQAGRGFETAPSSYGLLGEEQLRDIIINSLNTVFEATAATGETFSKRGKTDIFLAAPGGAILIAECKFWGGAKQYGETIDQLFGYLTWRHTVAILITFSRLKALTKIIERAQKATQSHASFSRDLGVIAPSHFTSVHVHPSDTDKAVDVHHLLFDLAV